jgi:hypothetical protein
MGSMIREGEADELSGAGSRLALRLVSIIAIICVGAAVVWFGFAASNESGAQMAAASAMFAAAASGWAGAFAAIKAKQESGQTAEV